MTKLVCNDCKHLNKTIKESKDNAYRYRCNVRADEHENGLSPFWLRNDNDLNNCGCSQFEEKNEQ